MDAEWKYRKHRLRAVALYWLLLPGAVLGGGAGIDLLLGFERWSRRPWQEFVALLLLALGGWFIYRADGDLAGLGGGTPSPARPARTLVTSGVYRLCRHPMFFGYDCMAGAVVLLCRSSGSFFIAYPLFLVWQVNFLQKEEKLLAKRFVREFSSYRQRVPFLLPHPAGSTGKDTSV